ncbi:MAG TPA: metallophosphoesterase [Thermoanaerobaculia bacterium]|nr:metallophosphoesterase [Thermoanaerobaculia bacterium]
MKRVFRSVKPAPGARLIFIGDIHGCFEELCELLDRVQPAKNDLVVSVGDIVTKGYDPVQCLELWRERGYLAVQGNNEIKLLAQAIPLLRYFSDDPVVRRSDLVKYIRSWPRAIDFPNAGVTAVHGGFLPDMRIDAETIEQEKDVIPELRWIRRKNGDWRPIPKEKKKKGDVLWAEKWNGDRFVVYGHTPLREPKFDERALGLDTGCVYGGKLTAAIYDGEWETVSVKAGNRYAE